MHNARILADAAPAEVRAEFESLEAAMIHRIQAVDHTLSEDSFGR
jgi:hypothetical protein